MPEMPIEHFEKKTFAKGAIAWAVTKRESPSTRTLLRTQRSIGLLLSHGCTIDKGGRRVTFALVEKAEKIEAQHQESLRAQEMASYVFLPNVPGIGDCVADMRVLVTLPSEFLENDRLGKMTPEAKLLLEAKLIHFYTRINEGWLEKQLQEADRTPT
jgi:hypothetical protein